MKKKQSVLYTHGLTWEILQNFHYISLCIGGGVSFANLPIFFSSFVKAKVAFLLKATFNKTEREREIVTFFVVSVII